MLQGLYMIREGALARCVEIHFVTRRGWEYAKRTRGEERNQRKMRARAYVRVSVRVWVGETGKRERERPVDVADKVDGTERDVRARVPRVFRRHPDGKNNISGAHPSHRRVSSVGLPRQSRRFYVTGVSSRSRTLFKTRAASFSLLSIIPPPPPPLPSYSDNIINTFHNKTEFSLYFVRRFEYVSRIRRTVAVVGSKK